MAIFPTFTPEEVMIALLIGLRISVLIIMMPLLGHNNVPAQVKAGLTLLIAFLLYPSASTTASHIPIEPIPLLIIAMQEILIAALLAIISQLIFAAIELAGQIVGIQIGLGMANTYDPTANAQISSFSQLAMIMAMLVWISTGAHQAFIFTLASSFDIMPVGTPIHLSSLSILTTLASQMFSLALQLVAPVLLLMFFMYVALGLLSRAVPQVQIFFVSSPATVALGLLVFALSLPAFISLIHDHFNHLFDQLPLMLKHLISGAQVTL